MALPVRTRAQQPDWPCQNPYPGCEESFVRNEWVNIPQHGLNVGTSMNVAGFACYDTLPHDDHCDMPYEGLWSSEWGLRPVTVHQKHYEFFDPMTGSITNDSDHDGSYYPYPGAGGYWVGISVPPLPIPEGSSRYRFPVPGGTSNLYRTRVDLLNGWTMPLVAVEVFWRGSWADVIEAMNHRGSGESGGIPEGFSFAQVVRGQSLVWFYFLTEYTKILLCVDEWSSEFACPGNTQNLNVRGQVGVSPNILGTTYADYFPFPMSVQDIDMTIPEVYLGSTWTEGGIHRYVTEDRVCYVSKPNCGGSQELHSSDSLDDRIEDVAYMIGATGAHEVGHAVGLMPFQFQGDEGGHSLSSSSTMLDNDLMAEHSDDTGGFGVIRDAAGNRLPLRDSVEWLFVQRRYLNYVSLP